MAISLGISALVKPNEEDRIRVHSADFDETSTFDLNQLPSTRQNHWTDFLIGVIRFLQKKEIPLTGMDILIYSDLPKSSGLSSSAALEVLSYHFCVESSKIDKVQMAVDCQRIENEFIGVNCGIMDQFAVANGKNDHAILLDCNTLEHEFIPFETSGYQLLIINSNKPRQLAHSAYNQRRQECADALKFLQQSNPKLKNLVDANLKEVETIEDLTIRKRAKHAVTEQQRVKDSVTGLKKGDFENFGTLLNASHQSLKDDFEVSCDELDFIVSHLQTSGVCAGARMTGAGFGGCCIGLIQTDSIDKTIDGLKKSYLAKFGFEPSFYSCNTSDGVHTITS